MYDVVRHGSGLSNSGFSHHLGMRCSVTLAQLDKTSVWPLVPMYQIRLCVYMLLFMLSTLLRYAPPIMHYERAQY